MKLSTRTRYGIRAVIELAEHTGNGPLQLKIIARRQGISVKYLEQLIAVLRTAGLVRSIRGAKGGYVLAKPADQIRLIQIVHCLEGPVMTAECVDDEEYCDRAADCAARGVWAQVQQAVENVLESITLQDLVDRTRQKRELDYQI